MFTADQAAAISLALKWGYLSQDEINDLAVAKIEQHVGTPPVSICELAMSKQDFEMNEILSEMAANSSRWSSLKCFLKTYIEIRDLDNSEVSKLAQNIALYVNWEDVEPWIGLSSLNHEISDARNGIFSDFDEYAELCQKYRDEISNILSGKK